VKDGVTFDSRHRKGLKRAGAKIRQPKIGTLTLTSNAKQFRGASADPDRDLTGKRATTRRGSTTKRLDSEAHETKHRPFLKYANAAHWTRTGALSEAKPPVRVCIPPPSLWNAKISRKTTTGSRRFSFRVRGLVTSNYKGPDRKESRARDGRRCESRLAMGPRTL